MLAADDQNVYFSMRGLDASGRFSGGVYRAPAAGGEPILMMQASAYYDLRAYLDHDQLYIYEQAGGLHRIPTAGGAPVLIAEPEVEVEAIAADADHLYLADLDGVRAIAFADGAVTPLADGRIASDDGFRPFAGRVIATSGNRMVALQAGADPRELMLIETPDAGEDASVYYQSTIELVGELYGELLFVTLQRSLHDRGRTYEDGEPIYEPQIDYAQLFGLFFAADGEPTIRRISTDVVGAAIDGFRLWTVTTTGALMLTDPATGVQDPTGDELDVPEQALDIFDVTPRLLAAGGRLLYYRGDTTSPDALYALDLPE
jgi:hypothetical protein